MAVSTDNSISNSLLDSINGTKSTKDAVQETEDRFLTLLVEQMKNQDPLNPMDNAQVTSQMAQLSTVTGIDKLNETMAGMISNIQAGQSYQAANMIGHNVLVAGDSIENSGTGGFFGVEVPTSVENLQIAIKNGSGEVVKNIELSNLEAGVAAVQWDGVTNDGENAPNGHYTFTASASVGESKITTTPLTFAAVSSVSTDASGVRLNLSNQSSVGTNEVKEIF